MHKPAGSISTPMPTRTAPLRTGEEYIRSIKADGRNVFLNGERVQDVTTHPAFRGAVRSIARLFDIAADPANRDVMTCPSPITGEPVLRCYQIPQTTADLTAKRAFYEKWAEATCGLMGRTPDHVAGFFTGWAAKPGVLARGGKQYADNLQRYFAYAREQHQYISYTIVPPQIDRSKPAHKQSDPSLYAGVVKERDDGIVLRGAQQLGTGTILSDWLQVSVIPPLQPGDENYAINVVLPVSHPGVKLYSRRAFPLQAANSFDYPLTGRFDESDALLVLEDAFVPWEHVFVYRDIGLCRAQWWETPAHSYGNHQAQSRYATKLRFMMGLAQRMNEITGNIANPAVMIQMGELAALAQIVESMVHAQEAMATIDDEGVVWPSLKSLYAVMALQSELNPRMIDLIREMAGGVMIMQPSAAEDFANPAIAQDIERYVHSPGYAARDRIALLRMAWDFIGTEFAGRHQQYEKFYGGASFLVKQNMYRNYDFKRATGLVDAALSLPPF